MKKILFPFYDREIHANLFSKKWFKGTLIVFPILLLIITFNITVFVANNLYLYCYDELQEGQRRQTLEAVNEINSLNFDNSGSELKALQIQQRNSEWFDDKMEECRGLASEYSKHMIPVGIAVLVISFYVLQLIFFSYIKNKPNGEKRG